MRASSTIAATPRLKVLSEDQKETLFLSTLDVLEQTGIRIDNDEGLELLSSAGANVGPQAYAAGGAARGRHVRIPSFLVEKALASTPRRISIYNRSGERAVLLEDHRVYFCSQVDSAYFFDPLEYTQDQALDHNRRACVRADARLGAVLCDALPNIHMVSFSSLYSDVPGKSPSDWGTRTRC